MSNKRAIDYIRTLISKCSGYWALFGKIHHSISSSSNTAVCFVILVNDEGAGCKRHLALGIVISTVRPHCSSSKIRPPTWSHCLRWSQ